MIILALKCDRKCEALKLNLNKSSTDYYEKSSFGIYVHDKGTLHCTMFGANFLCPCYHIVSDNMLQKAKISWKCLIFNPMYELYTLLKVGVHNLFTLVYGKGPNMNLSKRIITAYIGLASYYVFRFPHK